MYLHNTFSASIFFAIANIPRKWENQPLEQVDSESGQILGILWKKVTRYSKLCRFVYFLADRTSLCYHMPLSIRNSLHFAFSLSSMPQYDGAVTKGSRVWITSIIPMQLKASHKTHTTQATQPKSCDSSYSLYQCNSCNSKQLDATNITECKTMQHVGAYPRLQTSLFNFLEPNICAGPASFIGAMWSEEKAAA